MGGEVSVEIRLSEVFCLLTCKNGFREAEIVMGDDKMLPWSFCDRVQGVRWKRLLIVVVVVVF